MPLTGGMQLRLVAANIRAAGNKGLGKEMAAALRKATKPIQRSIKDELVAAMPTSGGYQAIVSKSVRFRAQVRAGWKDGSVRLTTDIKGKSERRDIRRLNRGELRHPVYGRSRNVYAGGKRRRVPNPWATTKVTGKFFERGTANAADECERQLMSIVDSFAARLLKG